MAPRSAPSLLLAAAVAIAAAAPARGQDVAAGEAAPPAPPAATRDVVDGIAAQVGTEVVLISDVDRLADPVVSKLREQGATDADIAMLRGDVLDRLIERKLITLLAKRAEIEASEYEIDEAVAAVAQENGLSADALRQTVEAQGLSWSGYRARLGDEIVQSKVVGGMVRPRVTLDEKEIEEAYQKRYGNQPTTGEELHLQHIAIGVADAKPSSKKAACDRVRAALVRVHGGEDFLEVAREVSEGSADLGWVHRQNLAPWMLESLDRMQAGQTSDVLQLPVGCAVLRLVERREVQPVSYEQAKEQIRAALFEERFQAEYDRFLERLRKQTYVERKGAFADADSISAGAGTSRLR
jgi:peptidyl-prolyl cis-trans isomerase SurA